MKIKLSDQAIRRIAQVWQPEDDTSVDSVDAIRSFVKRMQNILSVAEGEDQQESVFSKYMDSPEIFDRDEAVREMLVELANDILAMGFVKNKEITTRTRFG